MIADHFNAFVAAIEVSALAADAEEAGIGWHRRRQASGQGRREGGGCGEERPDLEVKRQLDAARELLFLLRIEPSTPADDPLFAATADDGTAAGRTEATVVGGGASSNGTRLGEAPSTSTRRSTRRCSKIGRCESHWATQRRRTRRPEVDGRCRTDPLTPPPPGGG